MPHQRLREVFGPEQLEVAIKAYEKALEFITSSGDADDDPRVEENIAIQIIAVGRESPNLSFVELTNRAISRYREKRALMLIMAHRVAAELRKA